MRCAERVRNRIESSPALGGLYARLGVLPGYRGLVMRQVERAIAEVRSTRRYPLMIETSSACNARCLFCPNRAMTRKRGLMTNETFGIVLDRLRSEALAPPVIDLFDVGEPLLDPSLFTRVRALKAAFPDASVRFTTNFSLGDEEVVDEVLDSGLDSIHISVNAASRESYARIMGLGWDTTVRNVDRLIARRNERGGRLRIVVCMVVCPENAGEVSAFARRWSRSADALLLQRAVDWGGEVGVASRYPAATRLYPCRDLFERIVVLNNGEVALCCQDANGIVNLNARDLPLLQIFESAVFARYRRAHLSDDIASVRLCRNCFGVHSNGANWLFGRVG